MVRPKSHRKRRLASSAVVASASASNGAVAQPVNSKAYWARRFEQDWDAKGGPAQSRFFYSLALANLPQWLLAMIRTERPTICDWGCATGEGAACLAQALDVPVEGVDFAEPAIRLARSRHSRPTFLTADFLAPEAAQGAKLYDILFTSNVLEHFDDPWHVLAKLSARASSLLVVLVPYREYERIGEHVATFDQANIQASIAGRFHLVHAQVLDTRHHTPSFWEGEQILLVYAGAEVIARCGLRLSDLSIGTDAPALPAAPASPAVAAEREVVPPQEMAEERAALYRMALDVMQGEASRLLADLGAANARHQAAEAKVDALSEDVARARSQIDALRRQLSVARDAELDHRERLAQLQSALEQRAAERSARRVAREGSSAIRSGARFVTWRAVRMLPLPRKLKTELKRKVLEDLFPAAPRPTGPGAQSPLAGEAPLAAPRLTSRASARPRIPVPASLEFEDVFQWGVIDWHFRIQRPQHIARGLARRGHRTFYFSSDFIDSPEPGYKIETLSDDGRLNVVRLHVAGAPSIYASAATKTTDKALRASLAVFIADAEPRAILSIVQHPFWTPFADIVPNRRLIYDMMDHHAGFGDGAADILELEQWLLRESDQVIVTSDFLADVARAENGAVAIVRNAAEYEHFATRPERVFTDPKGRRVIGYYGAIAHWFDVDLIKRVAERFPEALILLVGADSVGVQAQLKALPNVMFTGEVKYTDLPYYLYGFDVCLLPFKIIPLTQATNPVKIYEYLSAGKPVVSVDVPEVAQFGSLVAVGGSHDAFLDHIHGALSQPADAATVVARRSFAARNTWDVRVSELAEAVAQFQPPKVSIIVITYNSLELTDACLLSLERHTHYPNLEIIVVDNASQDQTPDFLRGWASRADNRTVILNDDNRGFAAANNQGIAAASGEYIVLLNNDTYVTPGWLGTLIRHLRRHPTLGLVGPVTNNIGNEAKIDIAYDNMYEMQREALAYTSRHLGQLYPLRTVAFFCVAMSRQLIERVGTLDEAFGIGMFEDDDYCRRVEQGGLSGACAEDAFVHHHHSASFKKIATEELHALFQANRAIYEGRWGPWVPHTYRNG